MTLPNFICPGAQKAGTTTLHAILRQHPDIFLPAVKETKFFQDNQKYQRGIDYYKKEFSGHEKEKCVGEIDPEYMFYDYVAERIARHLPETKLVFMLRHPVDRAYSNYWMSVRRGIETKSFEEALRLERERTSKDEFGRLHFSYIARGRYAGQIKRYMQHFDKGRMFFIIFEEDFLLRREQTIHSLLSFLGVEPDVKLQLSIRSNPASLPKFGLLNRLIHKPSRLKKILKVFLPGQRLRRNMLMFLDNANQKPFKYPRLDPQLRKELLEKYFMDDIQELSDLIGRDLSGWLNQTSQKVNG